MTIRESQAIAVPDVSRTTLRTYQAFAFWKARAYRSGPMKSVRIGAGLGFYGDSWRPVRASIESGGVQYIASDHLAELTLAILQKDRQKDPARRLRARLRADADRAVAARGRARREVRAQRRRAQSARRARGGGARVPREGLSAKIAVVTGNSISDRIDELQASGETLANMDTGADIASVRDRIVFANAYLGATADRRGAGAGRRHRDHRDASRMRRSRSGR